MKRKDGVIGDSQIRETFLCSKSINRSDRNHDRLNAVAIGTILKNVSDCFQLDPYVRVMSFDWLFFSTVARGVGNDSIASIWALAITLSNVHFMAHCWLFTVSASRLQ